jgi:hypothetical protein
LSDGTPATRSASGGARAAATSAIARSPTQAGVGEVRAGRQQDVTVCRRQGSGAAFQFDRCRTRLSGADESAEEREVRNDFHECISEVVTRNTPWGQVGIASSRRDERYTPYRCASDEASLDRLMMTVVTLARRRRPPVGTGWQHLCRVAR